VFSGENGVGLAVGKSITTTLILDCTDMVGSVPVLQWRIPKGHFVEVVSL
jgi:hypothetical protein